MTEYLKITNIHAREILDSRGNPTVEAEVVLRGLLPPWLSTSSASGIL